MNAKLNYLPLIAFVVVAIGLYFMAINIQVTEEKINELYFDPEIGLFVFEYPFDDDTVIYTVKDQSHQFFYMVRNAEYDEDGKRIHETITVRNEIDEPLTLYLVERNFDDCPEGTTINLDDKTESTCLTKNGQEIYRHTDESNDIPFELEFKPRNEEVADQIQNQQMPLIIIIGIMVMAILVLGFISFRNALRMARSEHKITSSEEENQ